MKWSEIMNDWLPNVHSQQQGYLVSCGPTPRLMSDNFIVKV